MRLLLHHGGMNSVILGWRWVIPCHWVLHMHYFRGKCGLPVGSVQQPVFLGQLGYWVGPSRPCHDFLLNQNPSCKISIFISVFWFSYFSKYSSKKRQSLLPAFFPITNVVFASQTRYFFLSVFTLQPLILHFLLDRTLKTKIYAKLQWPRISSMDSWVFWKVKSIPTHSTVRLLKQHLLSQNLVASVSTLGAWLLIRPSGLDPHSLFAQCSASCSLFSLPVGAKSCLCTLSPTHFHQNEIG